MIKSNYELTSTSGLGTFQAGYDAAESSNRRRAPRAIEQSEDQALTPSKRKRLLATTRDVRQNFTVARWAISKHLDFTVSHNFQSKSGDKSWDDTLEAFIKKVSHKEAFDVRAVHPLRRYMRIKEAGRTVDGDSYSLKIRGGFLQGLEGDRIKDPPAADPSWVHGIRIDSKGRRQRYAIHKRAGRQGFTFEREVSARRIIPFGYFDRFDQYRGISPLASAIRDLMDVYDGFDYALAREKVNQLFTLAIYRDSPDSFFDPEGENVNAELEPYQVDFSKGPNVLDLDPGDRAEYLTTQGTTADSQKFWELVISIALKALDIPFSFFREDYTNFFGSRAALMLYLKSVKDKRLDVVDFLNEWLLWRLVEGEANGEIQIPLGYDPQDMLWDWIPDGVPWWNPLQEAKANQLAVQDFQRSRTEIRREQFGDDWKDVVDAIAAENEYLSEKGLTGEPGPTS